MRYAAPELALMIGLGVGVDYALFIVTRFRENYRRVGDIQEAVVQAMDTSGRAILLVGTTVIIALLGVFATGVAFLYGLSIASVLAVMMTMSASLTVLPALHRGLGRHAVACCTAADHMCGKTRLPARRERIAALAITDRRRFTWLRASIASPRW